MECFFESIASRRGRASRPGFVGGFGIGGCRSEDGESIKISGAERRLECWSTREFLLEVSEVMRAISWKAMMRSSNLEVVAIRVDRLDGGLCEMA